MFQRSISPSGSKMAQEPANVERFRARHRRMCRGNQYGSEACSLVESLDVHDGRTRKIPAKWRQNHNCFGVEDGNWPVAAGTEMHIGFNAFDFSASPEAFLDDENQVSIETEVQSVEENQHNWKSNVEKEVVAMGFNSASMWGPIGRRVPTGPLHPAALNQNRVWKTPSHPENYNEQLRASDRQLRYCA